MGNVVSSLISAVPTSLAVSLGVPLTAGMIISFITAPDILGWYQNIKKPSWTPPDLIFGPMWGVMYFLMGLASHRVYAAGGGAVPLTLYGIQLVLNLAWNPIFFKAKNLKLASIDITVLLGVLSATIYEFSKVDTGAAKMLLPYLAWVTYAAALSWSIFSKNDPDGRRIKRAAQQSGPGVARKVEGAASEATAQAATPFLEQGRERQADYVPRSVAGATSARTGGSLAKDD